MQPVWEGTSNTMHISVSMLAPCLKAITINKIFYITNYTGDEIIYTYGLSWQGLKGETDLERVEMGDSVGRQGKVKVPRRTIFFASGETMEEYSTDEEEEVEEPVKRDVLPDTVWNSLYWNQQDCTDSKQASDLRHIPCEVLEQSYWPVICKTITMWLLTSIHKKPKTSTNSLKCVGYIKSIWLWLLLGMLFGNTVVESAL